MALRDIPSTEFPMGFERYCELCDELDGAAGKFVDLGYPDLGKGLAQTRAKLQEAWDAIAATERDE